MKQQKKKSFSSTLPSAAKKRSFEEAAEASVIPLSERLNALFRPSAGRDVEDDVLDQDHGLQKPLGPMFDERLLEDREPVAKQAKLRIVSDIAMDPKLEGRRASRKDLEQFSSASSSSDEADGDGNGDEDDDGMMQRLMNGESSSGEKQSGGEEDDDDDDNDDGDLVIRSDDEDDEEGEDHMDLNEDSVAAEEEEDQVLAAFQETQRQEMEKAKHTEMQNKVWNRMLALRIKMQAEVTTANSLPLPTDAVKLDLAHHSAPLQNVLKESLADMAELRNLLLQNHSEFSSVQISGRIPSKDASSKEWWGYLEQSNRSSVKAEEDVIDSWTRQANLQSGRALKALGKTVVEQVRTSMIQDRERLLKRTRLNRSDVVPLHSGKRYEKGENYEENIFDDSEFYAGLLKQFLQSTGASAPGQTGLRKKRDRKEGGGGHGRAKNRLNMQIQEKLLNFMAPLTSNVLPAMADPLFASLFGRTPDPTYAE